MNRDMTELPLIMRLKVSARSPEHDSWCILAQDLACTDRGIVSVTTNSSSAELEIRSSAGPDKTGCVQ